MNDKGPHHKHPDKFYRRWIPRCGINLHKQPRKRGVWNQKVTTRVVFVQFFIFVWFTTITFHYNSDRTTFVSVETMLNHNQRGESKWALTAEQQLGSRCHLEYEQGGKKRSRPPSVPLRDNYYPTPVANPFPNCKAQWMRYATAPIARHSAFPQGGVHVALL